MVWSCLGQATHTIVTVAQKFDSQVVVFLQRQRHLTFFFFLIKEQLQASTGCRLHMYDCIKQDQTDRCRRNRPEVNWLRWHTDSYGLRIVCVVQELLTINMPFTFPANLEDAGMYLLYKSYETFRGLGSKAASLARRLYRAANAQHYYDHEENCFLRCIAG